MSKSVKKVVAVVAAVAPAIVGAIAGSTAIAAAMPAVTAALSTTAGAVAGSAIVGAGLGAVSAKVTGGDVGRGALMGAIGGGIGGYANSASIMGQAGQTQAVTAANATADPIAAMNASQGWTASSAPTANLAVTSSGGVATMDASGSWVNANGQVVPSETIAYGGQVDSNLAAQLSSTGDAQAAANAIQQSGTLAVNTPASLGGNTAALGTTAYYDPSTMAAAPGAYTTPSGEVFAASPSYQQAGLAVPASQQAAVVPAASAPAAGTTTAGGTAAGGAAAPKTFSEALMAKMNNPAAQADMVLRAAGQLAGSALAGDGLSEEEQQLLTQQTEELRQLRETNEELFNQRLQEAQNLIGEAKYFDPAYFGMQSERAVKRGVSRAKREALRGIGKNRAGLRASEERRFDLAGATGGETAYLQGADAAQQNRIRTLTSGLGAMPTGGNATSLQYGSYLGGLYDAADRRRRQAAGDVGDLFGSFTGDQKSKKAGLTINYG
jgi:hypothetical protein